MCNRSFLLLASLLFMQEGAQAACTPVPVEVSVITPDPVVTTNSRFDVANAAGNGVGSRSPATNGWHVTGLAAARPKYDLRLEGETGVGCFRPRKVSIVVGFSGPIEVFISAKYQPGSCEYETVKNHEMNHVAFYRQSIILYRNVMHYEVYRELNNLPMHALQGPGAQDFVFQTTHRAVKAVFDRMMQTSEANNARIDTPESYLAEQSRCGTW